MFEDSFDPQGSGSLLRPEGEGGRRRLLVGNDPGKAGWIAWIDADT